jgi:hypothetical protein
MPAIENAGDASAARKEVLAMTTSRLIAGTFWATLLAVGLLGAGVCSADPPPGPPGRGEPGYCGAHTDTMDCWANAGIDGSYGAQ